MATRSSVVRGFFAGSGLEAMSNHDVVQRLLRLTGRVCEKGAATTAATTTSATTVTDITSASTIPINAFGLTAPVHVAYLGTATYDLPVPQAKQTQLLQQYGCNVRAICVADPYKSALDAEEQDYLMHRADIVLISGGNTLYAIRRWEELGMKALFHTLADEGRVILAGGSAGAICWFTSGHSDSADPSSYRIRMLRDAEEEVQQQQQQQQGESRACSVADPHNTSAHNLASEQEKKASWNYIRVHGLDILPGLVGPHYDKTQSNGVQRAADFHAMMRRHPTERGVAIDHWAVLVLPGDGTYEVFSTPGKKYHGVCDADAVRAPDGRGAHDAASTSSLSAAVATTARATPTGGADDAGIASYTGNTMLPHVVAGAESTAERDGYDDHAKSHTATAATHVCNDGSSNGIDQKVVHSGGNTYEGESDECVRRSTDDAPSVFTLDVVAGVVRRTRAPKKGLLCHLLREPTGPLTPDPFERYYAMENPTPSSGSLVGHSGRAYTQDV